MRTRPLVPSSFRPHYNRSTSLPAVAFHPSLIRPCPCANNANLPRAPPSATTPPFHLPDLHGDKLLQKIGLYVCAWSIVCICSWKCPLHATKVIVDVLVTFRRQVVRARSEKVFLSLGLDPIEYKEAPCHNGNAPSTLTTHLFNG